MCLLDILGVGEALDAALGLADRTLKGSLLLLEFVAAFGVGVVDTFRQRISVTP